MRDEYFRVPAASTDPPEPRTAAFSAWKAWSPVPCALFVSALFIAMEHAFHLNELALSQFASAKVAELKWLTSMTSARTNWATTLFASTLVMVVLAFASIKSLVDSPPRRFVSYLLGGFVLLVVVVTVRFPSVILPPMTLEGLNLVARRSLVDPRPLLLGFLAGLYATASVLTVAVAAELGRISSGVDPQRFRRAQLDIRNALGLTTVWLIMGVIGIALCHRMIATAVAPKAIAPVEQLLNATTLLSGAFYSAGLAAVFGPAEVLLRGAAASLTEELEAKDAEKFEVSVAQSLLKVLAVFGPLIAGLLSTIAEVSASDTP